MKIRRGDILYADLGKQTQHRYYGGSAVHENL